MHKLVNMVPIAILTFITVYIFINFFLPRFEQLDQRTECVENGNVFVKGVCVDMIISMKQITTADECVHRENQVSFALENNESITCLRVVLIDPYEH